MDSQEIVLITRWALFLYDSISRLLDTLLHIQFLRLLFRDVMESFRFQLTFFSLALSYLLGLLIRENARQLENAVVKKRVTRLNINSPNALQGAPRHKLPSEYVQFWQVLAGLDQSVELCAAEDHELADKTIITFIKTLNSLGRDLSCVSCPAEDCVPCALCVLLLSTTIWSVNRKLDES